jgi:hypothetical protein
VPFIGGPGPCPLLGLFINYSVQPLITTRIARTDFIGVAFPSGHGHVCGYSTVRRSSRGQRSRYSFHIYLSFRSPSSESTFFNFELSSHANNDNFQMSLNLSNESWCFAHVCRVLVWLFGLQGLGDTGLTDDDRPLIVVEG